MGVEERAGGAIVVGPVRRGRGRKVRVERRIVPVSDDPQKRIEVLERDIWRIAVENLDYAEQHVWAALAGARRYPDRVTLTAGIDERVLHGLGRELVGWMVTRQSGAGSVWEVSADRDVLVLQASLDLEVDLWLW